jgi:outer membrane protein OmpA-like peptidoglycan-associated protein
LAFAPETATLSAEAKAMLKDLAARFPRHDENARLQLIAYASGEGMSASKARRLSLARALSVREYLIANGIEGTRMDVRALGEEAGGSPSGSPADSPANRVDIAMIKR